MEEQGFQKKFVGAIVQIMSKMEEDKRIYGNAYIEFTDRKIELINPDKVLLNLRYAQNGGRGKQNER